MVKTLIQKKKINKAFKFYRTYETDNRAWLKGDLPKQLNPQPRFKTKALPQSCEPIECYSQISTKDLGK